MAKLSDLDNDPLPDADLPPPIDVGRFLQCLKAMELDPMYTFAFDTIAGIRITVEHSGHVTSGQAAAIHNIEVGAQRGQDGRDERRERGRYRRRWER